MNNQDKSEFESYLQNCSDRQVYGVLEKEQEAGRDDFAALARAELDHRGLSDGEPFAAHNNPRM